MLSRIATSLKSQAFYSVIVVTFTSCGCVIKKFSCISWGSRSNVRNGEQICVNVMSFNVPFVYCSIFASKALLQTSLQLHEQLV